MVKNDKRISLMDDNFYGTMNIAILPASEKYIFMLLIRFINETIFAIYRLLPFFCGSHPGSGSGQ
jgi:hypothetical protein